MTPYRVLLAEFLLRRTTRAAVSRVFQALVERFTDVESLYRAPQSPASYTSTLIARRETV